MALCAKKDYARFIPFPGLFDRSISGLKVDNGEVCGFFKFERTCHFTHDSAYLYETL